MNTKRLSMMLSVMLTWLAATACTSEDETPFDKDTGDTERDSGEDIEEARSELARDESPDISDDDYRVFVDGINAFGFSLFSELSTADNNVVFSGLSVAEALGMTYAGARNNTAEEMAAAMNMTLPNEVYFAGANRLAATSADRNIALHTTEGGDKSLQLDLVNQVWAQSGYSLEASFLDVLAVNYGAGVKLLDFFGSPNPSRIIINDWVAEQTKDKIKDLIPEPAITSDTKVVLVNALYFFGSWAIPFEPSNTHDGAFITGSGETVTVPTMHMTETLAYSEGDGYQIVDLPYDGWKLKMSIILPAQGRFSEIRESLDAAFLASHDHVAASNPAYVQLALPKFKFTFGSESLTESLKTLGIKDAFDPLNADFSGISNQSKLFISDVFHKAFIAVDEYGTEAAAATAVVVSDGYMPGDPVSFAADRPFLFVIRDVDGPIYFLGQVTNPAQ